MCCRSVAASRAGDDSGGRFLMAQAHSARAQALAAHEVAAAKIEAAMNREQGRGLWELDLHGLHTSEVCPSPTARAAPAPSTTFEGLRAVA